MTNSLTLSVPDGVPFIDFTREIDAPVGAVFESHRDPLLISRWLAPHGYEMVVEEYDFRTGGSYRYIHRNPEGHEFRFNGVFHVVRENEFAIQTFEFEGYPDVVSIESLRFEDLGDGRTRLSGHAVYPSLEARDGMAQSGMEAGMSQCYERLDAVAAGL
jgi:uncharacterized protein YndB with AHSA1/START domain